MGERINMKDQIHTNRIKQELKDAGLTSYGLLNSESRYLPQLIHEDEHIGGVVYGKHKNGLAMLVATDRRVIFLDKKPKKRLFNRFKNWIDLKRFSHRYN